MFILPPPFVMPLFMNRASAEDRNYVLNTLTLATITALFAFAISIGEFGATSFIARPASSTIPVAIFRLLGRPGTFGEAMAMAVILMVITGIAAMGIESIRGTRSGGV